MDIWALIELFSVASLSALAMAIFLDGFMDVNAEFEDTEIILDDRCSLYSWSGEKECDPDADLYI